MEREKNGGRGVESSTGWPWLTLLVVLDSYGRSSC